MGRRRGKRVLARVKMELEAGRATPAPPVGTRLGPFGLSLGEFVRQYNDATSEKAGTIVPAEVTVYEDRTFSFVTKTPPTAALLREAAGGGKGSGARACGHHHRGATRKDRRDQDAGPQRRVVGGRDEGSGGDGPQHGHRGQRQGLTRATAIRRATIDLPPFGGGRLEETCA